MHIMVHFSSSISAKDCNFWWILVEITIHRNLLYWCEFIFLNFMSLVLAIMDKLQILRSASFCVVLLMAVAPDPGSAGRTDFTSIDRYWFCSNIAKTRCQTCKTILFIICMNCKSKNAYYLCKCFKYIGKYFNCLRKCHIDKTKWVFISHQ